MKFKNENLKIEKLIKFIHDSLKTEGSWVMEALPIPLNEPTNANSFISENGLFRRNFTVSGLTNTLTWFEKQYNASLTYNSAYSSSHETTPSKTITYDFGVSTQDSSIFDKKVVNMYSLSFGVPSSTAGINTIGNFFKSWVFQASNDGTVWKDLDSQSITENFYNLEKRFYKFDNEIPYRFYRIWFKQHFINTSSNINLYSFNLYNTNETTDENIFSLFIKSSGSSLTDNLCLEFTGASSSFKNSFGRHFEVGLFEDLNLNSLSFSNSNYTFLNYANLLNNNSYINFDVELDINADRIILLMKPNGYGEKLVPLVLYVGLPERVTKENNSNSLVLATNNGLNLINNNIRILKNKNGDLFPLGKFVYLDIPNSPSMWGDVVFPSPLFVESNDEGIRGQLSDIYTVKPNGLADNSTLVIDGIEYTITLLNKSGSFPYEAILFKK